ncbi:hypothetical protein ACHAXS_004697, partial [Conticribra weissflogii]
MELIVAMRQNTNAAALEKTAKANLRIWFNGLVDDFNRQVEASKQLGFDVTADEIPPFPSSWIAKGLALIKAFLHDYLNQQDGLNREMASLLSNTALAIDHQNKV